MGKRYTYARFSLLLAILSGLTAVSLAKAAGPRPPSEQEIIDQFECQPDADERLSPSATNGKSPHSLRRCGQDWSLGNGSTVYTIRMHQLYGIYHRLAESKQASQSEKDAMFTSLKQDHFCDDSDTYETCYSRTRRRILADAVTLRGQIINANTARHELQEDFKQNLNAASTRSDSNGQIVPGTPQASETPPNARKPKTISEVISKMRHANDDKTNPPLSDCYQNPFVPCEIHFGAKNFARTNTRGNLTSALVPFAEKKPLAFDSVHKDRVGNGVTGDAEKDLDVRDAIAENTNLAKKLRNSLAEDSKSGLTRVDYQAELLRAQNLEKGLDAENRKKAGRETEAEHQHSISWTALNQVLDSAEAKLGLRKNQNISAATAANSSQPRSNQQDSERQDLTVPITAPRNPPRQPASTPNQAPPLVVDEFINEILENP